MLCISHNSIHFLHLTQCERTFLGTVVIFLTFQPAVSVLEESRVNTVAGDWIQQRLYWSLEACK